MAICDHCEERVYPRPRGGTEIVDDAKQLAPGLSPPTRGNQIVDRPQDQQIGSIPAHAGEPRLRRGAGGDVAVYPRPRGGTSRGRRGRPSAPGLSPPTRGNHRGNRPREPARRSIPAHAGEPSQHASIRARMRVYPRPRGGTRDREEGVPIRGGLSPPTRGNRTVTARTRLSGRSIPAHAGEPQPCNRPAEG